jgi:hypothetical protein
MESYESQNNRIGLSFLERFSKFLVFFYSTRSDKSCFSYLLVEKEIEFDNLPIISELKPTHIEEQCDLSSFDQEKPYTVRRNRGRTRSDIFRPGRSEEQMSQAKLGEINWYLRNGSEKEE